MRRDAYGRAIVRRDAYGRALAAGAAAEREDYDDTRDAYRYRRGVAYCEERYRSYDRSTGTYLGSDGRRRSCP